MIPGKNTLALSSKTGSSSLFLWMSVALCWTCVILPGVAIQARQVSGDPGGAVVANRNPGLPAVSAEMNLRMDLLSIADPVWRIPTDLFHELTGYRALETGEGTRQDPVPVPGRDELLALAISELGVLENSQMVLKTADTKRFWAALQRLYESGAESRPDVLVLYRRLGQLDLPALDRLEVCRFLGQDHYFNGRAEEARTQFDSARSVFQSASDDERQQLAGKMANILYLRGGLLRSLDHTELALANDTELMGNPLLRDKLDPVSYMSGLERQGDQLVVLGRHAPALGRYGEAHDLVLEQGSRSDRIRHQIRLSLKKVGTRAKHESWSAGQLREELDQLRVEFQDGDYEGYDTLLQSLVVQDRALNDRKAEIRDLKELRAWLLKKGDESGTGDESGRGTGGIPVRRKNQALDATRLLLQALVDEHQLNEARGLLEETIHDLVPPRHWIETLPDVLVTGKQ